MIRSIRRRLSFYLLGLILLAWLLLAVGSFISAREEVQELFDAHLAQSARVLNALITHEIAETGGELDVGQAILLDMLEPGHLYESKLAFTVHNRQGRSLFQTENAPAFMLQQQESGFLDHKIDNHQWRLFHIIDASHGFSITVAQNYEIRNELISNILLQLLWPLLLILPLLSLFVWFAVNHGLSPLKMLAREVHDRSPSNLEKIDLATVPSEVMPVMLSLNDLLDRLEVALQNERRFTSDAAHELRTPLAGIKAQAQVALRASTEAAKNAAIRQAIIGVDRMSHLIRQMLMLARLDPELPRRHFRTLDLAKILTQVAADLAPAAIEKNIELAIRDDAGSYQVRGQREALSVLVRNLLDNAIRYTPENGWVDVRLRHTPDGIVLKIIDSGPGIAEEHRERVFDRFYRGLGTGQTGSGLGLSIVQRVASLHDAQINFVINAGGDKGVQAEVTFPPAPRMAK